MLEDLLIISAVFVASVVVTVLYVSRMLRHPPQPLPEKITVNPEELPRPLETSSSVRALKMDEMIMAEEKEVARLLKEIEDLERGG